MAHHEFRTQRELLDILRGAQSFCQDPFERFLIVCRDESRRRDGIFFTPRQVAEHLVSLASQWIKDEWGDANGMASLATRPDCSATGDLTQDADWRQVAIQFFEPALGTGAIAQQILWQAKRDWQPDSASRTTWSTFLANHFLPRLSANEISPIALTVAHLNLAQTLIQTGFDFSQPSHIPFRLEETLTGLVWNPLESSPNNIDVETDRRVPPTVILGNPPFGALTRLPPEPSSDTDIDYRVVAGQRIDEKKTWLHDNYVRFFHHCHRLLDNAPQGLLGLITARSYLDNMTFRGMRYQLLCTFDKALICDLGGDLRGRQGHPEAHNVFGISSPVACSLFLKHTNESSPRTSPQLGSVEYHLPHLSDTEKSRSAQIQCFQPQAPYFFLTPRATTFPNEYREGFSLYDAMPTNGSAAITARDRLLVDTDRERLESRIAELADPRWSDEDIRNRWFRSTRSKRYAPGDSRSWRLPEARLRLQDDIHWRKKIRAVHYRPWDYRWMFWADYMIDWPRPELSRHMDLPGNLALIARRQSPVGRPTNYFWATSTLAVDGILRSDNRGNETMFPLKRIIDGKTQFNFSSEFENHVSQLWQLDHPESHHLRSPLQWLAYLYAQFQSSDYQERYADALRLDFPRVIVSPDRSFVSQLMNYGRQLLTLHAQPLETESEEAALAIASSQLSCLVPPTISGLPCPKLETPQFSQGRLRLCSNCDLENVPAGVWEFQAGAHQTARKWLRDRRQHPLSESLLHEYISILKRIEATQHIVRQIDQLVQQVGGWSQAACLSETG